MVMDLVLTLCKYDLRKGMTVWGSVGEFVRVASVVKDSVFLALEC